MADKIVSFRAIEHVEDVFDGYETRVVPKDRYPETEVMEYTADAQGLFIHSENTYSRAVIENAPDLKVIGKAGSGIDNIDVAAATENGVKVVHVPGMNAVAVSEHVVGMILSLYRRFRETEDHLRSGGWRSEALWGTELRGKTVGLIGLGAAGSETAKRLRPFGVDLIAHDPYVDESHAADLDVELVDLDDLLDRSDVVSVHVRLNEETRGMLGADELARLDEEALLVNTSRGAVVEEDALISALREGRIGGAGLDVFWTEPPGEDHPLFDFDNVLATPHLAGATRETRVRMLRTTAECVVKAIEGEPIDEQYVANPDA